MGWARVNGVLSSLEEARVPATDLGFLTGWTVFETMRSVDGGIPLIGLHLSRLEISAAAAEIAVPSMVEEEVREVASRLPGIGRIRVTLTGSGTRVVSIVSVPTERMSAPVRCVRGSYCFDPYLPGSVKHGSRAGWMVAVARAKVDDVLLVDATGRFTEGTTCGIVAIVDGSLWTARHDERILSSTTVSTLVEIAKSAEIAVIREGPEARGPWDALYIASATRGLAPVVELDGEMLSPWDPVGRQLAAAFAARAGLG